jgi:hypothetical protein
VTSVEDAAAFLRRLAAEPHLMDAAPADFTGELMDHRARDEVHGCLRCGRPAQVAMVAHTKIGPRWLDLCAACNYLAQLANDPHPNVYDPPGGPA